MSEHTARIEWERDTPDFDYDTFTRDHRIHFSDSVSLQASSAADYSGTAAYADPEQQLAGAVSSCHMLTFLALACKWRLVVDRYTDEAVARLGKNEDGLMAVTHIELNPRVRFAPDAAPDAEQLARLHEKAHKYCFVANSLRAEVTIGNLDPETGHD